MNPQPPTPFAPRPDDAARQAKLAAMKRTATGMLAAAALVFLAASVLETRYPWLGYLRATAEASVVGGLADWFAVTALFRHPLGIPIPHTAIIGRQKDRIGRIIGNFVQQHFLARDAVSRKLREMHLAERAARWLSLPENGQRIAAQVASGVAKTLEALPDEKIRELIHRGAADRIRATRAGPVLGKTLALVVSGDGHQELLKEGIRLAAQAVTDNRELIRQRVRAESPWWVPGVVDEQIYQRIINAIEHLLHDISANPAHPVRASFDAALRNFVDRLQHSPEAIARAEAFKEEWLDDAAIAEMSGWLWDATRRAVSGYATRAEVAETPGPLARGISAFGSTLIENQKLLAELDELIIDRIVTVVEGHRAQVADLIAETVAAWDAEATSQRMELAVGRDLQFVRINGTLVGGLVGLLIYAVPKLFR
ncbi:MAG TPA: DUF445 domain-containing protein [Gemmatimonadales bacterium]|jgi:uncharacterized membrane-anchored protein YjiN (DUF445 family)|nr:DUF445 domain-containing protein [Gemmatimonadales bacterium]